MHDGRRGTLLICESSVARVGVSTIQFRSPLLFSTLPLQHLVPFVIRRSDSWQYYWVGLGKE